MRERFHINIIGIKQGENVTVDLDPSNRFRTTVP